MWPHGKRFAFTVFDDTDNDVISNTIGVYRLLAECNLRTTKSVWVYPPRDGWNGLGLLDPDYQEYVKDLSAKGFEIGLHNIGSGEFSREEICRGLNIFRDCVGYYPRVHTNHVSNPDNLYWGAKRFVSPLSVVYALYQTLKRKESHSRGDEEESAYFWGDMAKNTISYVRNFTFNDINTLRLDRHMPYTDTSKSYVNYWFSSSDGHTVKEFTDLIHPENVDRLESEGGLCIVYTHFASGFIDERGVVHQEFANRIKYLSKKQGWFAPVSEVLDWIIALDPGDRTIGYTDLLRLNLLWLRDRVAKRLRYGR